MTAAALVAVACVGCAGHREAQRQAFWPPAAAGFYKVRLQHDGEQRARRFRLLLYAELPDRLHGEVLSPLGRTELIADAGDGRIYILFVREQVAFAGPTGPQVIEDLLGVKLSLEDLLRGLLTGEVSDGSVELRRDPTGHRGLPDRLELEAPPRSMVMELKRRQELRVDPAKLGTGEPPAGVEVRPLESLDPAMLPGVEVEDGS